MMDWLKKKWGNLIAHTYCGRLNRKRYFFWNIGYNFSITAAGNCLSLLLVWIGLLSAASLVGYLFVIADLVVGVLLVIGRLHDLNYSGWYAAIFWGIVIVGGIYGAVVSLGGTFWPIIFLWFAAFAVSLCLLFKRGTMGETRYGADPLEGEE